MNERVRRLRERSLDSKACISAERAELITEFCGRVRDPSVIVRRALAFKYLMENKTICINDGELIVGERGPASRTVPTYPELCCHSLGDLDILRDRGEGPFCCQPPSSRSLREEDHPILAWPIDARHDLPTYVR